MTNPNKVYSREALLGYVWGNKAMDNGDVRTVDVHVRRLREKIEPSPSDPKIRPHQMGSGILLPRIAMSSAKKHSPRSASCLHESRSPAAFFHRANAREPGEAFSFPWLGTAESIIPIPASCPHESRSPASFFHRAWHCVVHHPNPPIPPSKEITMQNINIKTHIKIIQASPADLDAVTAVEAVCFPRRRGGGTPVLCPSSGRVPGVFFPGRT